MATPELGHRMYGYTLLDCIVESRECSNCKQYIYIYIFFFIIIFFYTSKQHTATDLVNLLYFLRPVSSDHTDFEFEQDK